MLWSANWRYGGGALGVADLFQELLTLPDDLRFSVSRTVHDGDMMERLVATHHYPQPQPLEQQQQQQFPLHVVVDMDEVVVEEEVVIEDAPPPPLQPTAQLDLPKDDELANESLNSCTICIGDITAPDMICRLTHCGHIFHFQCLEEWARHQRPNTCPNCKTEFALTDCDYLPAPPR